MEKKNYDNKSKHIMELAEENGVQNNYFFEQTFKNYQFQLEILDKLEQAINDDGILVTKEYVKGRKNVYSHPAISDFNRTVDSSNKTVSTLMKIIKTFGEGSNEEEDTLMDVINGSDEDAE